MRGRKRGAEDRTCLWCHSAIDREQPDIYIPLLKRYPPPQEAVFGDVPTGNQYDWIGPHCGWHCAWYNGQYELCGEAWTHFQHFYFSESPIQPPPMDRPNEAQEAVQYDAKRNQHH